MSLEAAGKQIWTPPSSPMTTAEFNAIGGFIQSEFGIKMPPTKRTMLQARLIKRLRAMNMSSYQQYKEYLFSPEGIERETPYMIDVVTTNKTDFFRESAHFDLLCEKLLLYWFEKTGGKAVFTAWSAGCASGEEPYSIAMVLNEFTRLQPSFKFEVIGTDVSGGVIEKARAAIYPTKKTEVIPDQLKKRYLMKSKDRKKQLTRVVPELRSKVSFYRLNLMETFTCPREYDIIFCRNVIIYFDRSIQEQLFNKCCYCLKPGGYLFIGHSETLGGMDLPLKLVQPTVYQKI